MTAFIEYDEEYADALFLNRVRGLPFKTEGELPVPFASGNSIESLTEEEGLYTGSKDYVFFGAISGVRNRSEIDPLYTPRGLPFNLSRQVNRAVKNDGFNGLSGVGWLTLEEINAALEHQAVNRDYLSQQTWIILDVMETLERRFGRNRVRLIFGFD